MPVFVTQWGRTRSRLCCRVAPIGNELKTAPSAPLSFEGIQSPLGPSARLLSVPPHAPPAAATRSAPFNRGAAAAGGFPAEQRAHRPVVLVDEHGSHHLPNFLFFPSRFSNTELMRKQKPGNGADTCHLPSLCLRLQPWLEVQGA